MGENTTVTLRKHLQVGLDEESTLTQLGLLMLKVEPGSADPACKTLAQPGCFVLGWVVMIYVRLSCCGVSQGPSLDRYLKPQNYPCICYLPS